MDGRKKAKPEFIIEWMKAMMKNVMEPADHMASLKLETVNRFNGLSLSIWFMMNLKKGGPIKG